jgi:hypothetical protein
MSSQIPTTSTSGSIAPRQTETNLIAKEPTNSSSDDEEKDEEEVPIGTLNLEIVTSIIEGLQGEKDRAVVKRSQLRPGMLITKEYVKMTKIINAFDVRIGLLTRLCDAWKTYMIAKKVAETNTYNNRPLTGVYKNLAQAKCLKAARTYNKFASLVRQKKFEMLTPEHVPNAIKSHQINAPSRAVYESTEYCSALCTNVDETDGEMIVAHKSRRHVCRYPTDSLIAIIEHALHKAIVGNIAQAHEFGTDRTIVGITVPAALRAHRLLLPCCGKTSTGGNCTKFIDALDPKLFNHLGPALKRRHEMFTAAASASASAAASSGPEQPTFKDMMEYFEYVEDVRRCKLQLKYGADIYTFCPNTDCFMHSKGFFVQEILQRRIDGAKDDEYVRGYHASCPSCKKAWCLVCKTDHRTKTCLGPYAKHIAGMSEEDARALMKTCKPCPSCKKLTYKVTGCNEMFCNKERSTDNDTGCGTYWCFRCGGLRDPRNSHTHVCPPGIEYDIERDSRSEQE